MVVNFFRKMVGLEPRYSKVYVFLDIDGVLYPNESIQLDLDGYQIVHGRYGQWHMHKKHGEWLKEIQTAGGTLIWETSWGEEANDFIIPFYEMQPLPFIDYNNPNIETAQDSDKNTFKLPFIKDTAQHYPVVLIDDELKEDVDDWANTREAPTLIIKPEPHTGLSEEDKNTIIEFINDTLTD